MTAGALAAQEVAGEPGEALVLFGDLHPISRPGSHFGQYLSTRPTDPRRAAPLPGRTAASSAIWTTRLEAYDRIIGLELADVAADGCITKA